MHCEDDRPLQVLQPATIARALRHPIRRATLATVLERDEAVPIPAVASAVVARATAYGAATTPDDAAVRPALYHRHVPILASADLVDRPGPNLVAPGDHRLLAHRTMDTDWLRRDGATWDALGAVFGQPRRRVAVRVLADADLPVGVDALARTVAAELIGELSPEADALSDLRTRLHHVDLPMLADADVLTYDTDATRVVALSPPDLPLPVAGF